VMFSQSWCSTWAFAAFNTTRPTVRALYNQNVIYIVCCRNVSCIFIWWTDGSVKIELSDFEFYTTLKDAPSDKLVSFIRQTGTLHIYSTDASSYNKLFFCCKPSFQSI
jgi:hypothetical protein